MYSQYKNSSYQNEINLRNHCSILEEELRKSRLKIASLEASLIAQEHINSNLNKEKEEVKAQAKIIPELIKNIKSLEKKVNKRSSKEQPYGSNTSSSRKNYKKNTTNNKEGKNGGGKKGHKGNGRKDLSELEISETIKIPISEPCSCGSEYNLNTTSERFAYNFIPSKIEIVKYEQEQGLCPNCGDIHLFSANDILPRYQYTNSFLAHILSEHYFHGQTAGKICSRYNIGSGTFFNIAHSIAEKLKPIVEKIELEYLNSLAKHADETTWSTDGMHSWAYGFFSDLSAVFRFRHTRASTVPRELFKEKEWSGVLIRDRYAGYNSIKCRQQYCYSHLIRNIEDLLIDFPNDSEVERFVLDMKKVLKKAIRLRKYKYNGCKHRHEARIIKNKIIEIISAEAKHPGVQKFQNVFRENEDKMYQWTLTYKIPAENNFAERKWRPVVIARKISFGSQSEKGRLTRETLMSFLVTADMRGYNPENILKELLDSIVINPEAAKNFKF